jgi:hypothetical protein
MNWQCFPKSLHRPTSPTLSRHLRYQPTLSPLEDRTLPSTATLAIDPTQSSLSITGTVTIGTTTVSLVEQAPGSLTTTYEGAIHVDIDPVGHTINFLNDGVTAITADNSGSWQPLPGGASGNAPANYGSMFTYLGTNLTALRNVVDGMSTSTPVSLLRAGLGYGVFYFPSTQNFVVNTGDLDYNTTFVGQGTLNFAGLGGTNQANAGLVYADGAGDFILTVPVNVVITDNITGGSFQITVAGSLTAYGSYDPPNVAGFSQVVSHLGAGNDLVGGIVSTGEGLGSAGLSGSVSTNLPVTQDQVQDSRLDQGGAPIAHLGGTGAAVDAVFQDPLQSGSF